MREIIYLSRFTKQITVKQLAIQILGYGGNSPGPKQHLSFSDKGRD